MKCKIPYLNRLNYRIHNNICKALHIVGKSYLAQALAIRGRGDYRMWYSVSKLYQSYCF